ncbi:CD225/dispanin family protein [Spirillospora sp. NPDC047279]|uniref:CD225/dispanin family protein n=1 Tax=Spirillospora sp. NPDC047279 TaxID=3155478 RepID=UPI0033F27819
MSYNTPGYGGYPSAPQGPPPPNHLVWAILTTIFCCLPLGIVSIVFSTQVNSKWQSGDHAGAQKASNNAKTWAIVSAVIGVIAGILSFVIQLALAS